MKKRLSTSFMLVMINFAAWSQDPRDIPAAYQPVVRITGVRFAYPLVEQWIENFREENPAIQIIIEPRGSADPANYDILVEAYEPTAAIKNGREYVYVGRYALLPVANSNSDFARTFHDKGLDKDLITQLFFHDIYSDKENQRKIKAPYTIYTRLQKAGAPHVFANYFGFEQKDIKGNAVAGSDEHLLKALRLDTTGVSYAPVPILYDHHSGKPVPGITVIPVDLDGNGKINEAERFYEEQSEVTRHLEEAGAEELQNVPIEYLHLSVDKKNVSPDALLFLNWVIRSGGQDLHPYGFLKPEEQKLGRIDSNTAIEPK